MRAPGGLRAEERTKRRFAAGRDSSGRV